MNHGVWITTVRNHDSCSSWFGDKSWYVLAGEWVWTVRKMCGLCAHGIWSEGFPVHVASQFCRSGFRKPCIYSSNRSNSASPSWKTIHHVAAIRQCSIILALIILIPICNVRYRTYDSYSCQPLELSLPYPICFLLASLSLSCFPLSWSLDS